MLRFSSVLTVLLLACTSDPPPTGPAGKAVVTNSDLPKPTNLRIEALTATSVRFRWDPVAGATDYDINYKRAVNGRWTIIPHPGTATFSDLTGLEPDTEYRWAVKADQGSIKSRWAIAANFTTLADSEDDLLSDSIELEIEPELASDPFNIDLVFPESFRQHFSAEDLEQIRYGASRWEEVLTDIPDWNVAPINSRCGDEPIQVPAKVDDLVLFFDVLPANWPANGAASRGTRRNSFGQGDPNDPFALPFYGCIELKPTLSGEFLAMVTAHEIGHVLGFGATLYQYPPNGLRDVLTRVEVGATPRDHKTFWIGSRALEVYHQAGGKGDIPLDVSHWKRTRLTANTLLNPLGNFDNPFSISTLDVAAMADLGYPVRMEMATSLK